MNLLTLALCTTFAATAQSTVSTGGAATDAGVTWPQWRGPTRDGLATGKAWAADLTPENLVQVWRFDDLGPSYSGPVVDDECVYTTETVDGAYEVVRAIHRSSGEELWSTRWEGSMQVPFFASRNGSWIRSTPALDGDSLFVAGIRDVLVCLDTSTGDVRWKVDFAQRFDAGLPPFGCASSALVVADGVILQGASSLVKLDKATGATLWRSMVGDEDMMSAGAFSSPVVATLAGKQQLVVQTRVELAGVGLLDGKLLWSTPVKAFRGMNILTPSITEQGVFTSTYGGRSQMFSVTGKEGGLQVKRTWETGVQGYMTSPVVIDGHAYLFLKSNRFACLDLATGEERWTSPPTGDEYWSLAAQGDRILALSNTGNLRLIQADPGGYRVLSEREVADAETWAYLAVAGDQVVVRALDSLIAFRWK